MEALLHGNITRTEAEAVAASVLAALPGATMAASARPQDRCVALQPGVVYLHRSVLLPQPVILCHRSRILSCGCFDLDAVL